MNVWKYILHKFQQWNSHLLLNYPVLWESRLLMVIPALFILFLCFFLPVNAISVDFSKSELDVYSVVGLMNTPQVLFLLFTLISGVGFLLWLLYQGQHSFWMEHGSSKIKRYAFKKNIITILVFLSCLVVVYYPSWHLSRKVATQFQKAYSTELQGDKLRASILHALPGLRQKEVFFRDSIPAYLDSLEQAGRSAERALILGSINTKLEQWSQHSILHSEFFKFWTLFKEDTLARYFSERLKPVGDSLSQHLSWTRETLEFFAHYDYPAYYRSVFRRLSNQEKSKYSKLFEHSNYGDLWPIFTVVFIPLLAGFLLYYFQLFGSRSFVRMCLWVLVLFILLLAFDSIQLENYIAGRGYAKVIAANTIRTFLLLHVVFVLLRAGLKDRNKSERKLFMVITIFPFAVVASRYWIFMTGYIIYSIQGNNQYTEDLIQIISLLVATFSYFILGTAFFQLLYRLYLSPEVKR